MQLLSAPARRRHVFARPANKIVGWLLLLSLAFVFSGGKFQGGGWLPAPAKIAAAQGEAPAADADAALPFAVTARAAVLLDVPTGRLLYAKNEEEQILPASLAKIMTMLLALEAVAAGEAALDELVTVGEGPWRLPGSTMFLNVGDRVPFEDLLYGIGVVSGNDASLAVAEHLAGTEAAFTALMNERAAELGLKNTVFTNSHGLANGVQTTSALDMALLARTFVQEHADGLKYMATKNYTYGGITQPNRNGLLFKDDRVTGLKTGFLGEAGHHLVATAQEGDMALVAVVLGTDSFESREEEALALLNYGFREFITVEPSWGEEGQTILPVYKGKQNNVPVGPSRRPLVTVGRRAAKELAVADDLPPYVTAPLAAGETVGRLTVTDEAGARYEIPLVVKEGVEKGGFFKVLWDSFRLFIRGLWQ